MPRAVVASISGVAPPPRTHRHKNGTLNVTYWLLVERLENWETDRQDGFRKFGIPERKQKMADAIRKGDRLIFYVSSGLSALSDIREAAEDGTRKLARGGDYDTAFPISISTRPYLTLDRRQWVSFRDLIDKLSITATKSDWRQVMRTSLLRLPDADAIIIVKAMMSAKDSEDSGLRQEPS
jgi:predicted RNA-binding protein